MNPIELNRFVPATVCIEKGGAPEEEESLRRRVVPRSSIDEEEDLQSGGLDTEAVHPLRTFRQVKAERRNTKEARPALSRWPTSFELASPSFDFTPSPTHQSGNKSKR